MKKLSIKVKIKTDKPDEFLKKLEKLCIRYGDISELGTSWSIDY